jgi:hypothetical protein
MNTTSILKRLPAHGVVLLALAVPALAQSYSVDWFTVDGGGGVSSGGTYTVSGTIGQPDAGRLSGGCYTVEGGFWGLIAAVQIPDAPLLRITRSSGGNVIISWPASSTGFVLQQTMGLSPPTSWTEVSTPVLVVGAENTVTVSATTGNKFFRLRCPP